MNDSIFLYNKIRDRTVKVKQNLKVLGFYSFSCFCLVKADFFRIFFIQFNVKNEGAKQ